MKYIILCSRNLQTIQVLLAGEQHSELALSSAHQLHLAETQHYMTLKTSVGQQSFILCKSTLLYGTVCHLLCVTIHAAYRYVGLHSRKN